MNTLYQGDNLAILREMPDESELYAPIRPLDG